MIAVYLHHKALQQMVLFKENNLNDYDSKAEYKHGRIAIFGIQLRHIAEIHAIPAGKQRQRQKHRRNHGKKRGVLILPFVERFPIGFA